MNPKIATLPYYQFTPVSISDREYWSRVKSNPRTAKLLERLDKIVGSSPVVPQHPPASHYLAARRHNNRGLLDVYWQTTRSVLASAVIKRCLDGDTASESDDFLLDTLWSFLTSPSWVVSAHVVDKGLPYTAAPQLDLAGCEMAGNLAESLQMLKPWMDNQSPTLADSIIYEIDRRVLTPFVEIEKYWWFDFSREHTNNWSGVCAGSILCACESLAALGHPRPAAREKALKTLNYFLEKGFTPAGECDEGLGYWNYGVGFAAMGWSRLTESELHQTTDMKRMYEVADYPRQVHVFKNTFYSGNDSGMNAAGPIFATVWLSAALNHQWLGDWGKTSSPDNWGMRCPSQVARIFDAVTRVDDSDPVMPAPAASRHVKDQQTAIFSHNNLIVTLSGGHNEEAHNHNDVGHVNVWKDQQYVLFDLGQPHYTSDFFGANRYTYLSASSRGHNCPIINNHEQLTGRQAAAREISLDLVNQSFTIDCTNAYPTETTLTNWTRSLTRNDSGYELTDDFTTSDGVIIENVFWSTIQPVITSGKIECGPLVINFDPAISVKSEPVDPKPHLLRAHTKTIYRICFTIQTKAQALTKFRLQLH